MPEFRFKAIDSKGKVVNGVSSAQDPSSLSDILSGQGLFLMESHEVLSPDVIMAGSPQPLFAERKASRFSFRLRPARITLKEVSFLTAQMSIMVRSALPILESLELLAAQTPNPELKRVLVDVRRGVNEGEPLSAAFGRHPAVFDEIFVSLIAAGEASGDLDMMLERLSDHLLFHLKLKASIRSVLTYPIIVMLTATSVVAFLVVFVLPTFMEVFTQLNIELPLPTLILVRLGEAVRSFWWLMILGLIAALAGFKLWLRDSENAKRFNRFVLATPIVGPLVQNIVLTRTLRTMGSLIDSGVSILKSLELSRAATGNVLFAELMERVAVDVREGKALSWSFSRSPHIPPIVVGMLATGERTGTLPTVIKRVAEFYESETNTSIKDLFSALEPIFIVGLGIMVGGIAVSVLLPMFDVAQNIQ